MRKKASRPLDGSPFVFFGVTLSAQSDFLDLGGSELEGPDSLPLLILHLCDSNRSVGVVTVVLCAADLVLGSELDLDGVAGGSSCGAAGCCGSSAGGSGRAAGGGQLNCNSRTGQIKNPPSECSRDFYDPYGNRTHVTAVKGPCLNRLTNGPKRYRILLKQQATYQSRLQPAPKYFSETLH